VIEDTAGRVHREKYGKSDKLNAPVALRTNCTLLLNSRSRLSIAILRALDSFDRPTLRAWGMSLIGFPPLLGLSATADSSLVSGLFVRW
jgi:hypothetical protein